MNNCNNEYEIVINNKRIWDFYNENKNISIENANLLLIDFTENMFNEMTNINSNINAQLLSYMTENKNQMNLIKSNLSIMNENLTKLNTDIANNIMVQFMSLKKDYIEDIKQIINNDSLTTNEKISSLMDKNNVHLIDKTTLILNDVIPKNQELFNKQLQVSLKQFYNLITEDTNKLAKTMNNDKSLQDFIHNFENKYSAMMNTIQQPLFSFFTASENRITQNIDVLKENSSIALSSQTKLQEELGEFLGKYNVSSNKGKFGEENLSTILNSIYQSAEIKNTTGTKSSGDFIMKRLDKPTIMFETKNYKHNIDKEEVSKFIVDIENQNTHGIFLSQYSGITFKQNYQIDIHKGRVLIYVQNCEYSIDKIRIAVDIIDNLAVKLEDLCEDDENNTISNEILNDINGEYQLFIQQKETLMTVLKDFTKKMSSQIDDLKFPELDKYLSQKYAYVKSSCFKCDLCNSFTAGSKQSLSAHKRGCVKKFVPTTNVENTLKKK
jgi:hypothetical protein